MEKKYHKSQMCRASRLAPEPPTENNYKNGLTENFYFYMQLSLNRLKQE